MKHLRSAALWTPLLAALVCGGCAMAPGIDPAAQAALKQMSDALGGASALSFRAEVTLDEPGDTGQLVQCTRQTRVVLRRPDRLYVEVRQGTEPWALWCRGTNLTVLGNTSYAAADVPGRIDQDPDAMVERYGLVLPLADLLFPDPYAVLTEGAKTGRYLGLHLADGVQCKHLLFTTPAVDWQIWIENGKAVPRKIVLDYKNVPGRPQFTAVLSDWDLAPSGDDQLFEPRLPKDARKVDMAALLGTWKGK